MLKLSLAYSAIELIHPTVVNNFVVTDSAVAAALRAGKFTKLIDAISKSINRRDPNPEVTESWAADADNHTNLLPLIKHCRHIMFHGAFSPNETRMTLLSRQTLLLGLGIKALESADAALEARITKLYAQRDSHKA